MSTTGPRTGAPPASTTSRQRLPNLVPVHGPIHARWLNPIEIYFSIVQRKALTPTISGRWRTFEERLLAFHAYYESIPTPLEWRFTKDDLAALMRKLDGHATALPVAAYQNPMPNL